MWEVEYTNEFGEWWETLNEWVYVVRWLWSIDRIASKFFWDSQAAHNCRFTQGAKAHMGASAHVVNLHNYAKPAFVFCNRYLFLFHRDKRDCFADPRR